MSDYELLLPSTLLYYVIKNANALIQLKISQASKPMKSMVQKIRNYSFEYLHIFRDQKKQSEIDLINQAPLIEAQINVKDFDKIRQKIKLKTILSFINLKINDFALIKSKIDLSKLVFLNFIACEMDSNILKQFCDYPVPKLAFSGCTFKTEFDVLSYSLKNMKNMESIYFDWQDDVTSLEDAANIKSNICLNYCGINKIEEFLCPKLLKKFAKAHMNENGKLKLKYSVYHISLEHREEIKSEMPETLNIEITYSDAAELSPSYIWAKTSMVMIGHR